VLLISERAMKKTLFLLLTQLSVGWLLVGAPVLSTRAANAGDSLASAKSHFVADGTNKVHYLTLGRGKQTILFVHCWAGRADFWRAQVPVVADRARLILIDLPGHGESDKPHTDYTMGFFANAVLAVMRDAKVDKATLVGHSMGAAVICQVYKQAPEKVAALFSVDGMMRRPPVTPEQAQQFIAPFRAPEYRDNTTRFLATMFPVPGTEALRDQVVADMLQTPQYVMAGSMEGMFGQGQPAWDLQNVKVPVLVINAKNPMWTPEYEEYVHKLSSQVEYRTMDGVGHWLMLEKPVEFNAAFLEVLQKHQLIGK
jgi:pimeloyl-ACP methyl ester carboxylesterase